MPSKPVRETVDLSGYPDLVVIYLGLRVNRLAGLKTLMGLGPQIDRAVKTRPEGLLLHESVYYSLNHIGMREYWRDYESLEAWTRSAPHREWWRDFLRDSGGTGFWHEVYRLRGGMEAVYVDVPSHIGLAAFAPVKTARGRMFSSRGRLGLTDSPTPDPPIAEVDFYR